MSDKIKSKDLSYDTSLPPFLQRLHAQKGGHGDQDRHERQIARPQKAKDPNDDDGPTVVDESGETLTKEQYADLTKTSDVLTEGGNVTGATDPSAEPKASGALPNDAAVLERAPHAKVTDGIAQKKRKVAKVIGDDEGEADDGNDATKKANKTAEKKPVRKKSKPIRLAFDDEAT